MGGGLWGPSFGMMGLPNMYGMGSMCCKYTIKNGEFHWRQKWLELATKMEGIGDSNVMSLFTEPFEYDKLKNSELTFTYREEK